MPRAMMPTAACRSTSRSSRIARGADSTVARFVSWRDQLERDRLRIVVPEAQSLPVPPYRLEILRVVPHTFCDVVDCDGQVVARRQTLDLVTALLVWSGRPHEARILGPLLHVVRKNEN